MRLSVRSIGAGIKRFAVFIKGKATEALRQTVRVLLLPFSRIAKRTKLYRWANANEPTDPEERAELRRTRIHRLVALSLLAGFSALAILIFGNPWLRAKSSFRYIGQAAGYVWGVWSEPEAAKAPEISNAMEEQFQTILANVKSFWYYFQVWIGALFNPDIAKGWGHEFLVGMTNLLRIVDWIPAIALIVYLIIQSITRARPEEERGESKALRAWNERIVPRFVRPIQKEILLFFDYLRSAAWFKRAFFILAGALCIVGWTALDTLTSYLMMVLSFEFGWFPTYFASVLVDLVVFFSKIGVPGAIAVGLFLFIRAEKRLAASRVMEMQSNNEDIAASLPNITAINGPVGSGKTTMMSSLVLDVEGQTRDRCLSIMKKYASAFPKFDWRKLEEWVVSATAEEEEGKKPSFRLHTRAQVKIALSFLWRDFEKSGYAPMTKNGSEAFFGYDVDRGLSWFDGAKEIHLLQAVQTYAECFFLYYSGQKLATSNYPIAFPGYCYGDHFPVYGPPSFYVGEKGAPPIDGFSHVMDMDFFRIEKRMDPKSDSGKASVDGGAVAITEASNERGNRFDYVGKKKTDDDPNPLNDGWNKKIRLVRHDSTIDGTPFTKVFYDFQRGDSMNAEARDMAEDTITIMQRGEEMNCLPFWPMDEFVCCAVENWWTNFYYYTWKPNRGKETLLTAFLGWLTGKFIVHRQRMRYRYGYEAIVFNREHGGMNGLTGQRTTETYFSIYRRTRGELFNTAVYGPILEQPFINAKEGWLDQPTYESVNATSEEFAMQHSYFIKGISGLFDPKETRKSAKRIKDSQKNGSDTPFEE